MTTSNLRRIYVESMSNPNLSRFYVESMSNRGLEKNPGACFWGHKKPLREWPHALPGFGQVPVSNPGLEPGASGVRRPRASPLGNLTTVGHLAKVSPDLTLHFHRFLTQSSITEKTVF